MSRKKYNLITKGLTSELFLLAFLEPDNARKLGQKLQNTTGHPSNYSKIHPALHELTISGYLKHKDGKYHPNISKLIDDFDAILQTKDTTLSIKEKENFAQFLERRDYLKLLTLDVRIRLTSQPKGEHKINALELLCERLGSLAMTGIIMLEQTEGFKEFINGEYDLDLDKINELDELFTGKEFETQFMSELEKDGIQTPPEILTIFDFGDYNLTAPNM